MSKWNHAICGRCWAFRAGDDGVEPVRLMESEEYACCICGDLTREGIFVRFNPELCSFVREGGKDLLGSTHESP